MPFRATNALGPGLKTNRAGKFDLSGKQKNGGSSEQAFAPSFLPSPEAEEKTKIQKKVLDTDIFRSCFLLGEYHTLVKEMRENDHESFYKYFRMTPERFYHLLLLVGAMLIKKSLNMALTWQEMSCDKIQGL